MKKILLLLICAITIASATACTNVNSDINSESSTNSGIETTVAEKNELNTESTKKYPNVLDYLEQTGGREKIDNAVENASLTSEIPFDFNWYVKDGALNMDFLLIMELEDNEIPELKNAINKTLDDMTPMMVPFVKDMVENVEAENPRVIVRYSVIRKLDFLVEKVYDKTILDNYSE